MDNADREYDLVMPFVVVESKDGPYDDDAYTAGYEMGLLDARLEAVHRLGGAGLDSQRLVHSANLPQADLVAMRHGFAVTVEHQSEEWAEISLLADYLTEEGP